MAINMTNTNGTIDGTLNQPVEVRAAIYSKYMMRLIEAGFLPEGWTRDVSDFTDGSAIVIPQIGEATVFDATEGQAYTEASLTTSKLTLEVTEFKGVTYGTTDVLKEDSYLAFETEAQYPSQIMKALKKEYETQTLALESKQVAATSGWTSSAYGDGGTSGDACIINGVPHRFVASGANDQIAIDDFIGAKLALDEAEIPDEGRIGILTSVAEATLNGLIDFNNAPRFADFLNTGFKKGNTFLTNFMGFDLYTSTRVAAVAEQVAYKFDDAYETGGTTNIAVAGYKANIFMCVADDYVMPFMSAWRRMPRVKGERKEDLETDYFHGTARWGLGIQRPESMVVVLTHPKKIK